MPRPSPPSWRSRLAFRTAVIAWWEEHRPGELTATADDPLTAAAAAVLTDDPAAGDVVAAAARRGEAVELRAERDAALSRVDKLTIELDRLRGELTEARAQAREAGQQRDAEYQQLRRRVSDQGARLRAAVDARAEAEQAVAELRRSAETRARRGTGGARPGARPGRGRAQARRPRRGRGGGGAASRARGPQGRRGAARRCSSTPSAARSRGCAASSPSAAAARGPPTWSPAPRPRSGGRRSTGWPALDALLAVPSVHLIVDGYNVSKTGYPELPLADQRTRLVGQLAALAARTGVEITVVFDGAGVVSAPTRGSRGVRVLFSDAGVLADDVIRDLVAAEPEGRPVLVATSDRAVVVSVRRGGAYSVPSAILLGRLARG